MVSYSKENSNRTYSEEQARKKSDKDLEAILDCISDYKDDTNIRLILFTKKKE
jgi:hypothetical protein